ncbi:hypothetical protein K3495_g3591 [Podosphaera aphanis]|nr:hypothetical protein K3495_g3591 [Podosphaera aphanis]
MAIEKGVMWKYELKYIGRDSDLYNVSTAKSMATLPGTVQQPPAAVTVQERTTPGSVPGNQKNDVATAAENIERGK